MKPDAPSFPDGYVDRIEAGPVDTQFLEALGDLSPQQREQLANLLVDREPRRRST